MKPYILLNAAMTLDGKIATKSDSFQISGVDDLIRVHNLRCDFDGIMVGIKTVLVDDPKLTIHKIDAPKSSNPVRIIIDSKARTPLDAQVLNDDAPTIIVVAHNANINKINALQKYSEVIITSDDNHVNLKEAMSKIKKLGINSVMLEGGATLNYSMFKEDLIDRVSVCIGAKILGGFENKTLVDGIGFDADNPVNLKLKSVEKIDQNDVILTYDVIK